MWPLVNSINGRLSTVKKIFSLLVTVLLSCVGLRKTLVGTLSSLKKKNIIFLVPVLLRYIEKTYLHSIPTEKNDLFSGYSTKWWMGKKIRLARLSPKKYISVSDYSTSVVHKTSKNFNWHSTPPKEKKNISSYNTRRHLIVFIGDRHFHPRKFPPLCSPWSFHPRNIFSLG